jgi:putative transposase
MARFDLTDFEWSVIEPLLPNKPRGVPRVDDRRVLNGIFGGFARARRGPIFQPATVLYTTCVNRFNRWRKAGVWDRLLQAVSKAYDGDIQMIDSSSIRVHQYAANGQKNGPIPLHGSLALRPDDKGRCAGRCRGPADRPQADRGTGA